MMPLSENEKRVLQEMEEALSADDPKLANRLRGELATASVRRYLLGLLSILAGMAILIAGLAIKNVPVGIAGFLVSFSSTAFLITQSKNRVKMGVEGKKAQGRKAKGRLSARLEERWEQRKWNS
jgi:hypothetical protein